MNNIEYVRLTEVVDVNPRYNLTKNSKSHFVEMAAVDENFGTIRYFKNKATSSSGLSKFKEKDILFARITPCTENGKVAIATGLNGEIGLGSTEFIVLSPKKVLSEWLYFLLKTPEIREDAIKNMKGTTGRQRVPIEFFETLYINVPKLSEQERIVKTLKIVREAIKKNNSAAQLSSSYPLSLLNKMLVQEETEMVRLKDVCDIFDRDHRTPNYADKGIPLISPANFTIRGINIEDVRHISREEFENEKKKCAPKKNDILFSRIGTIGEVRYAPNIDFIPLHSIAVIRANPEKILHTYLYHILQTYEVREQALAGVQSIGVPDLGLKKIENIEIPLLSLSTQKKFAENMLAFEKIWEKQMNAAEKLSFLAASLSNKYFAVN